MNSSNGRKKILSVCLFIRRQYLVYRSCEVGENGFHLSSVGTSVESQHWSRCKWRHVIICSSTNLLLIGILDRKSNNLWGQRQGEPSLSVTLLLWSSFPFFWRMKHLPLHLQPDSGWDRVKVDLKFVPYNPLPIIVTETTTKLENLNVKKSIKFHFIFVFSRSKASQRWRTGEFFLCSCRGFWDFFSITFSIMNL